MVRLFKSQLFLRLKSFNTVFEVTWLRQGYLRLWLLIVNGDARIIVSQPLLALVQLFENAIFIIATLDRKLFSVVIFYHLEHWPGHIFIPKVTFRKLLGLLITYLLFANFFRHLLDLSQEFFSYFPLTQNVFPLSQFLLLSSWLDVVILVQVYVIRGLRLDIHVFSTESFRLSSP